MSNEWGLWIGWNGGECPVDGDTTVEVCCRDYTGVDEAGGYEWGHDPLCDPIIAYRVKKEPVVEVKYVNARHYETDEVLRLEYTYTDGKLTKIHLEADE
jgi:hypothetical protein